MAVLKLTLLVFAVTLVSSAGIPASLRRGDGAARSSIVTSSSTGVAATGSSGLPKPAIDLDAKPFLISTCAHLNFPALRFELLYRGVLTTDLLLVR